MYTNAILDVEESATLNDIRMIENKFGFTMPKDFVNHYLKYNGGYPEKNVFVDDKNNRYAVDYFIPIKSSNGLDLKETLRLLNDENIKPNWLIPFADEEGGNLFCYSLHENELGAIYYYNHEFEYGDNPEEHVKYLAKSLIIFIESLIENDEE